MIDLHQISGGQSRRCYPDRCQSATGETEKPIIHRATPEISQPIKTLHTEPRQLARATCDTHNIGHLREKVYQKWKHPPKEPKTTESELIREIKTRASLSLLGGTSTFSYGPSFAGRNLEASFGGHGQNSLSFSMDPGISLRFNCPKRATEAGHLPTTTSTKASGNEVPVDIGAGISPFAALCQVGELFPLHFGPSLATFVFDRFVRLGFRRRWGPIRR